jgi:hypothetical protein
MTLQLQHTKAEYLTDKYFLADTRKIITEFNKAGFLVAKESKSPLRKPLDPRLDALFPAYSAERQQELTDKFTKRNEKYHARIGHEKHWIQFKSPELAIKAKGHEMFVRVMNSYDGSSGIVVTLDMLRLVCMNGLVAPRNVFSFSISHRNKNIFEKAIEASYKIIEKKELIDNQIDKMSSKKLSQDEKVFLVDEMVRIRFPDSELVLDASKKLELLKPIRQEEQVDTLYQNFNTLQEKLTKGVRLGLVDVSGQPITRKVREVKSQVTADSFNNDSWQLAMSMAS